MNFRWLLRAVAALATASSLSAYPLRVLAWDERVAARKLAISVSKGTEELTGLHPFQRSKVFEVASGEEQPAAILALDKEDAEGKPVPTEIRIPKEIKTPLLILLPDAKAASGLRLLVLEDALEVFNWGCIRLVNATGKRLVFKWEEKLMGIPAEWTPTQVKPGGADRNMQVQLFLRDQPNPPLYSAVWEQRDFYRTLVFIVPGEDPRLGPVTFKFLTEDRRVVETDNATDGAR